MKKLTLKDKISSDIGNSTHSVFFTKDFGGYGSSSQVGRALSALIDQGYIIRIGHGIYTKAKRSSLTGNIVPVKNLPELAKEALNRLGIEAYPSKYDELYKAGKINQVPTGRAIGVKKRVRRKIGYNGAYVCFEKTLNNPKT